MMMVVVVVVIYDGGGGGGGKDRIFVMQYTCTRPITRKRCLGAYITVRWDTCTGMYRHAVPLYQRMLCRPRRELKYTVARWHGGTVAQWLQSSFKHTARTILFYALCPSLRVTHSTHSTHPNRLQGSRRRWGWWCCCLSQRSPCPPTTQVPFPRFGR